ncbi:MAG: MFS transporter [Acidimicrobiales bacterium]
MAIKGFRSAGHLPSLIAALVHFDVSFMVWVLVGALSVYIAEDLQLSSAQKGLMVAVPPLGGSLFRLVVGPLADRIGAKRTGTLVLLAVLVPLVWGWQAGGTYVQVLGIGLLLGLAGSSFAVALPLASRWYPSQYQGLALGIAGAGNSGTIVASLAAPRLAEQVGWHGVFGLATLPVLTVLLFFGLAAKEPPRPAAEARRSLRRLLNESDARWLCLFYLVTFGGFVGMSGYLPILFVDRFALPKVAAAGYAALCAAAGSLLRPVGGALADRFGGTRVLSVVFIAITSIAVALATLPPLGATVTLLVCLLGAFGIGNGAVFQLVPQRYPTRIGAMTGLVGAAGGVGGFLLPFALGFLNGVTGSFTPGFLVLGAAAASAAVGIVNRQRLWRAEWQLEAAV